LTICLIIHQLITTFDKHRMKGGAAVHSVNYSQFLFLFQREKQTRVWYDRYLRIMVGYVILQELHCVVFVKSRWLTVISVILIYIYIYTVISNISSPSIWIEHIVDQKMCKFFCLLNSLKVDNRSLLKKKRSEMTI
jgi:hypothetical protein